ncbi:hypothetical protein OOT09_13265 [Streptomyces sp. NBC_00199]|nr:hypothetical protein [Streptomyces sp. NBC_00199]
MASIAAGALRREAFREALVATYVWGKGKRGSPGGSGPASLRKILAAEGVDAALARAVTTLSKHSAEAAYAGLQGLVPSSVRRSTPSSCTSPARRLCRRPTPSRSSSTGFWPGVCGPWPRRSVRETGHDPDGSIANWVWRDRNWSPHRYAVYLSFMQAADSQTAATGTWPPDASPDLLEYALFSASWT